MSFRGQEALGGSIDHPKGNLPRFCWDQADPWEQQVTQSSSLEEKKSLSAQEHQIMELFRRPVIYWLHLSMVVLHNAESGEGCQTVWGVKVMKTTSFFFKLKFSWLPMLYHIYIYITYIYKYKNKYIKIKIYMLYITYINIKINI